MFIHDINDINNMCIVFILFIAHITSLIVSVSLIFPSVQDAVSGTPAMPVILHGGKRIVML